MSALAREGTVRGPLNDPRLTSQIIDWSLKAADVSAACNSGQHCGRGISYLSLPVFRPPFAVEAIELFIR
jgi:hypothetical protein